MQIEMQVHTLAMQTDGNVMAQICNASVTITLKLSPFYICSYLSINLDLMTFPHQPPAATTVNLSISASKSHCQPP
jgi:hypothetical protein